MIIHKYLLPASLAATLHIALLWLVPEETHPRTTALVEIPLRPPIPQTAPDPVPQPEDRPVNAEPVKPLAGGPNPPELPEELSSRNSADLPTLWITHVMNPDRNVRIIPAVNGPGEFGVSGELGRPGVFSPADLDRVPNAKVQLPPDYPAAMRQSGVSGSVLVEFEVNAEGRVVRAEAIRYTDREFADPAVRAVKKWRFEPGRRNGQAVPFRLTVPIEFGIETG